MEEEVVTPSHSASEGARKRQAVTELLFFASVGDLLLCKAVVAENDLKVATPACCDYDRRTPLHLAAAEGAFSVVKWLLEECHVPVNPVDRFMRTPLEDAARGDHNEVANLLCQHGGKIQTEAGELVRLADSALHAVVRYAGAGYDPDWEIDPADVKLEKKIGEGQFGEVHRASWHGAVVAVKIIKDTNNLAVGDFRTELNVLQKVHHPHTVQFLGACTKQKPFMIVTEMMTAGSLQDLFQDPTSPPLRRAVELALDTARGMAYLHSRKPSAIVHRDLKPANLMITALSHAGIRCPSEARTVGLLKISDFGLSKTIGLTGGAKLGRRASNTSAAATSVNAKTGPTYQMTGETGSYRYMAPEVFRHEPYNNKVDVYSFAMIAYQLFQGVAPFWELEPLTAAHAAAIEHKRPMWSELSTTDERVPDALRDLVIRCWDKDYAARPEFVEIVKELDAVLKNWCAPGAVASGQPCCSVQ